MHVDRNVLRRKRRPARVHRAFMLVDAPSFWERIRRRQEGRWIP